MSPQNLPRLPRPRSNPPLTSGVSRRDFLIRAGLLGLSGPALAAFLAACTGGSSSDTDTTDTGGGAGATGGKLSIASWPFYIENDQDPKSAATIKSFMDATGIDVDYKLAIEDNVSFTEKFAPDLKEGKGIGFDIAIPTSWMCARWIESGWAEEIPAASVPNKTNLLERLANPDYDPGRKYTMPYAIGQVGIGYYPDKVGFEITSFADFLKPELKGKVTVLSEMRDTVGTFLLLMGVDPGKATVAEAEKAIAEIKKYRDQGHFKKITGNSYTEDLNLGDTWAALGWSGDIAAIQAEKPELKWVLPKEGAMTFVDTMIIPKGANVENAAKWINHIYDPKVAGPLYEAINYATPVKGAADNMTEAGKASVFINPAPEPLLYDFATLSEADAGVIEEAFAAATQQ